MKRLFAVLAVLVVLAIAAVLGGYAYWQQRLAAPIVVEEPTLYQVPAGAGFHQVVRDLASQRRIERRLGRINCWLVSTQSRCRNCGWGEYRLMPGDERTGCHCVIGQQ